MIPVGFDPLRVGRCGCVFSEYVAPGYVIEPRGERDWAESSSFSPHRMNHR